MSTEAAAQEQSAPTTETAAAEPAPFNAEAYEALTDARLSFAPAAEIARLEAALNEPPKAAAEEPVTETPTTEPEVAAEPTEEAEEEETPAAEVTEPATGEEPKPGKDDKEPERFRFKDPTDRLIAQTAKTLGISLAEAAQRQPALLSGINIQNGRVTFRQVADAHGLPLSAIAF